MPEEFLLGLYTSPHMVAVRERIRINGAPLSEEQFATFFFDVWDRLEANMEVRTTYSFNDTVFIQPCAKTAQQTRKQRPAYFRMLTLVAFHTFLTLKVSYLAL